MRSFTCDKCKKSYEMKEAYPLTWFRPSESFDKGGAPMRTKGQADVCISCIADLHIDWKETLVASRF